MVSCAQVLFLTIMSQLYAPLNSFSSNYRNVRAFSLYSALPISARRLCSPAGPTDTKLLQCSMKVLGLPRVRRFLHVVNAEVEPVVQLQKGLIDMENMFELLDRRSAVQDLPSAKPLTVSEGA